MNDVEQLDTYSRGFNRQDLTQTRSTFLTKEIIVDRHGGSTFGKVPVLLVLFVVTLIGLAFLGISILLELVSLIFGVLFIIAGWLEFSLLQTIEDIPTAKIAGAAEGLNEIQGLIVSENNKPLESPLSKQPCVFYQIELQELRRNKNNTYWVTTARFGKGIPALLTDKTGYLAVDIANADMTHGSSTRRYVVDQQNKIITSRQKEGKELYNYIKNAPNTLDISNIGIYVSETYEYKLTLFGSELSLLETPILINQNEFALGRVIGLGKTLNGIPVKAMVYDKNTKRFSLRTESKNTLETADKILTYVSLGLGILLLIIGIVSML